MKKCIISSREKRAKEQKKEYIRLSKAIGFEKAVKKFGLTEVIWAMNRFVRSQQELKKLHKRAKELNNELTELEKKMGK